MKKLFVALTLVLSASCALALDLPYEAAIAHEMIFAKTGGIADWKVGDTLNYRLRIKPLSLFVDLNATLKITQIDKEGVNIAEEISYTKYKIVIETLIDPETGAIKRTRINGKDQSISSGKSGSPKIVDEVEDHIFVPAFKEKGIDCIHLTTADEEGNLSQTWLNPSAVPLSGMLKNSTVQGIATIEMELVSFANGH